MKKAAIIASLMVFNAVGLCIQTSGQQSPTEPENLPKLTYPVAVGRASGPVGQATAQAKPSNLTLALTSRGSGVDAEEITAELRQYFGAPPDRGVLITRVAKEGVGAQLQLEVGDIAVAVEGWPITTPRQLQGRLTVWQSGRGLRVWVIRDTKERLLKLTPVAVTRSARAVSQPRQELKSTLQAEIDRLESRLAVLRDRLKRLEEDP